MGDYRDDRGALRQRVEELESDLERTRRANAKLEAELQRARDAKPPDQSNPEKRKLGAKPSWLLLVIGAGFIAWIVAMMRTPDPKRYPEPDELDPRSFPPPEMPDWGDRGGDMPVTDDLEPADRRSIPFVESASCRCEGGGASITLAYRAMRTETFEGRKTSFIEAAFHGSKPADLLLGSETVPPNSLEAKMTQFLLACDSRHVVLAFGARVTAWNRATGDPMWIATLPANVGSTKPGPFGLECTKLEVMAGAITLKHASGSTKLSMVDGEPVMP